MAHQARLDRYFLIPQKPQRSGESLPDLPWHVRRCIYSYLNLTREGHVHLNVEKQEDESIYRPRLRWVCPCDLCKHGTRKLNDWNCSSQLLVPYLLVCHTVYYNICRILYSRNHFIVSRFGPGAFSGIFKLGPTPLAYISNLAIRINECQPSCQDNDFADYCSYCCEHCDR